MLLSMVLGRMPCMVFGMQMMGMRHMGMMRRLVMFSGLIHLGCFMVMLCGLFTMHGSMFVVINVFFCHKMKI
jgi:hypothetical protein